MKVKIPPAYLGLAASQSKRAKQPDRRVTKNIWYTKSGLRIPIEEMTDYHLVAVVRMLRGFALRIKEWNKTRAEQYRKLAVDIQAGIGNFNPQDWDWLEDGNWSINANLILQAEAETYERISKMGIARILKEFVPCWPTLVYEGYKRGLLHSNGYIEKKGWELLGESYE